MENPVKRVTAVTLLAVTLFLLWGSTQVALALF